MLTPAQLEDRVVRVTESGCWVWLGPINDSGYGVDRLRGDNQLAHRSAWRTLVGDPGQLFVCHHCDVRCCVNPAHLFLGTAGDNNRDRHRKGRSGAAAGSSNGRAKLTLAQVADIRQRYAAGGVRQVDLAMEFGVHQTAIGFIVRGKHWRCI